MCLSVGYTELSCTSQCMFQEKTFYKFIKNSKSINLVFILALLVK